MVLVEGKKTDYRLMAHLLHVYGIDSRHEIVSYNTNIYTLYKEVFFEGDPASVDILQMLKEHERDSEKQQLFDARYTDILLIFDLDPQDPQFSADKVLEMMNFFVESSDMGKLYLNYPMVEAFYHMKSIPDTDYPQYVVSKSELLAKTYKARVNRENRNRDYSKFAADKEECDIVIQQNIDKAWMIAKAGRPTETIVEYLPASVDILQEQLRLWESDAAISVLCTCVFYIPDYNSRLIARNKE